MLHKELGVGVELESLTFTDLNDVKVMTKLGVINGSLFSNSPSTNYGLFQTVTRKGNSSDSSYLYQQFIDSIDGKQYIRVFWENRWTSWI